VKRDLKIAKAVTVRQCKPGLELPPGISPALVTVIPGTALAKNIPAGDTIIPG